MSKLDGLEALINKQFAARPQRKKKSYDNSKRDVLWLSTEKRIIRLLPYIHEDASLDFNPFKLFHIHYGKNNNSPNAPLDKMRVSPMTWGDEDVLVSYCEKIIDHDFDLGRALQPAPSYHVPVLLYDKNGENPYVCFWSMNPSAFEMLVDYYKNPEYGSLHDENDGCRLTISKSNSSGRWTPTIQPSRNAYPLTDDEKSLMQGMKKFEEVYTLPKEGEFEEALVRFVNKHFGDDGVKDEIEYSAPTSTPKVTPTPKQTPPPSEGDSEADVKSSLDDLDALLGD
jgi:hypothetical protein